MTIQERIRHFLFPHAGMEQVKMHDDCGGWIFFAEYACGVQMQCSKCDKRWEGYWRMGEQPNYHLEWKPKEEVAKFFEEED
jgi:hypothetical protein